MKKETYDETEVKYAVQSYYDIYKFSGSRLKNEEHAMQLMLQYFHEEFTEEQLRENMRRYNLDNMFSVVKDYFYREYGYKGNNIELNNLYQKTINSYIYNDKQNPAVIHIDELFESTVMAFFLAMFKWSKNFEDIEIYGNCYRYMLYLMNEVCILGEMQAEAANRFMLEMVAGDLQILQLAEDCYWTVLVFSLAHEMAHAYFADNEKIYSEKQSKREEFDADVIAYDIVLKIIMDKQARGITLEPYTYLAPMMYMDFFELVYYTDRILYKTYIYNKTHPTLNKRKRRLFAVVDKDEYEFDTREGNYLYRGFNEVYKAYRTQTILKMQKGKLKSIIRTERREKLMSYVRENDDE